MSTQPTTAQREIVFGHSPDPDDAFMFYAIAHDLVDTGAFHIQHQLNDIETLNRQALRGELEITAVSAHAYAHVADRYAIMGYGASVGDQYGPMVVAKPGVTSVQGRRIAIPGTWTTAALVMHLWAGPCDTVVVPFDQILEAVRDGQVDAGLIIHEGQLTYRTYGLECLVDLGAWWHETTSLPLPLGLDVVRRDLGDAACRDLSRILRDSIRYSLDHRDDALTYALQYGRGLDRKLADKFVGMYVNHDTLEMGARVVAGLEELYRRGVAAGVLPTPVKLDIIRV
ncbi:MAG TPA: MqnA/MqnD/SBP family protein [Candidatus Xenobia bacterium]|jgi:1,4-dihydroxy-6-naphthoate synthase